MRILLFADAFPPFQSSASIQLKDLVDRYVSEGHSITIFTTSRIPKELSDLEMNEFLNIIRIRNPITKNVNFSRRAIAESLIPITTLISFFTSKARNQKWDGIIWYSPSIFFGLPIFFIKKYTKCKTYLILRDIFPEWALNVGHIKKGPIYIFFKLFESIQYHVADRIGVQSDSNISYFKKSYPSLLNKVEVLNNWLSIMAHNKSSINLDQTALKNRFNLIYAGNIGSAQGLTNIMNFVIQMKDTPDIGFIFVGDGDAKLKLLAIAKNNNLTNILFFDPIPHAEIYSLYKQCNMGIVSLDMKHETHNIPGKLLSYLQAGLPIFALVNQGNDILKINKLHNIGIASSEINAKKLKNLFMEYYAKLPEDHDIQNRCFSLSADQFSDTRAFSQTMSSFK